MKRILQISAFALLITFGSSLQQKASAQFRDDITYQTFYDDLSPYGEWINYPEYGYVWQPSMGADFRPYSSGGHWVWSDEYEWIWASDYDWGWAPFHYGRWFSDPYYGWLWVPGYEWAPAWVVWRTGGDYYGWAPVRPGINISIGFSIGNYDAPYDYWCFAPRNYITSPRIYDYCIDRRQNVNIFNSTVIINNYNYSRNVFVTGPRRSEVEIYTRQRINPVRFNQLSRPGRTEFRNNEISIYRPNVQQRNNNGFSPRNFQRYDGNRLAQNDNRFDRTDNNGFGRNNNNTGRNGNANRGNNLPQEQNRNNDPRFERRNDNNVRQPQNNNDVQNNNGRSSRFERRNNNVRQQQDNNGRNNQFERGNDNNPSPMREQRPDTRNENRGRQFEQQRQQQPRQFEQRPQQQPRQFEQRSRQEQQPRQFEQRSQQQNSNGNNRSNGRQRGRN